jgi:hypothetical protein
MQKLTLEDPVQWGEKLIDVLEFNRLKAKHIRGLGANRTMGDMLDLVSKSTLLPTAAIDELSAADALKAVEIIGGFLQGSQKIGEDVSE